MATSFEKYLKGVVSPMMVRAMRRYGVPHTTDVAVQSRGFTAASGTCRHRSVKTPLFFEEVCPQPMTIR